MPAGARRPTGAKGERRGLPVIPAKEHPPGKCMTAMHCATPCGLSIRSRRHGLGRRTRGANLAAEWSIPEGGARMLIEGPRGDGPRKRGRLCRAPRGRAARRARPASLATGSMRRRPRTRNLPRPRPARRHPSWFLPALQPGVAAKAKPSLPAANGSGNARSIGTGPLLPGCASGGYPVLLPHEPSLTRSRAHRPPGCSRVTLRDRRWTYVFATCSPLPGRNGGSARGAWRPPAA